MKNNQISHHHLELAILEDFQQKPEPFTPGEPLFWNDPHISKHMLATHLDQTVDQASRRPEVIDTSVAWIVAELGLQAGDHVLDMGCGPGLYASRLAGQSLSVTGVDFSMRSIDYARNYADDHGLDITYCCQDYLTLADESLYAAVLLIFGDYCTFNPKLRRKILRNVSRALKPGGFFVLDVSTRLHRELYGARNGWQVSQGGFWRPGPHLVLERGFDFPEEKIYCDQYVVIEADGKVTVYRNWFQDYDRDRISLELEEGGFAIQGVWDDLTGTPYSAAGEWIGVVAKKV